MKATSLLLILSCLSLPAFGQQESLLIGPADMLHVQVYDTPELEEHVRVTDGGTIALVLGGEIQLVGLTPRQAAQKVEDTLKQSNYLLDPHVTITVEQYATQSVSVLGQVRSPGRLEIGTPRPILEVLAQAGGLTEAADRNITIKRRVTKGEARYFVSNDATASLKDQPLVYPGDTVIVPKVPLVYLLGDVGRPGGYPAITNDSTLSVLQAVSFAGGTPPNAAPSKARLIRKQPDGTYLEIALPLSDMQKGKRADIPLRADDILYVPFSYARNILININGILAAAASASVYRF